MTTAMPGTYPFGSALRKVEQEDRRPKRVFVLGVYSSAVHAQWIGADGRTLIHALAVASEPTIFWNGEGAETIIKGIALSSAAAGSLVPANQQFNGPSGRALDAEILKPLGLTRAEAWLCDLVPHTCLNDPQRRALDREYTPERQAAWSLPAYGLPPVPTRFADEHRRREVLDEVEASQADVVILLGDLPLRDFLSAFEPRRKRLADFGKSADAYGRLYPMQLGTRVRRILPLAHPRQVAGLGAHSPEWRQLHEHWKRNSAQSLLK